MSRIAPVLTNTAPEASKPVLEHIQRALGGAPVMFRVVGHSPAALKSMWGAFGALGSGSLSAKLGEQIAVAVANFNACEYCLAAHTALGQKAGVSIQELADAQVGRSSDARTEAALKFAIALVRNRGQSSDVEIATLRNAGYSDEQIVEIIAHVALNLFTNYVNVALGVPVDSPAVKLRTAA